MQTAWLLTGLCVAAGVLAKGALAQAGSEPIDPATATTREGSDLLWYDIRALGVEGQGFGDLAHPFDRLPAKAEGVVREPVWDLSHNSAGLCVRFVADATTVSAHWKLRSGSLAMDHMPATGVSGLDLYGRDEAGWHWVGVGRPGAVENDSTLASGLDPGPREFILYLPLYNGVDEVLLGLPKGATLSPAPPRPDTKPIVFYGTSVTQGGCAARPGMAYPAILGRWLGRATVNLGFSGNGQMEPEVAELVAEIDAAAYVIDCLPNMSPELVTERAALLVRVLRKAHPDVPIVLVENITYQQSPLVQGLRDGVREKNEALREAYDELVAEGVTGLTYMPGAGLLGGDGEATVDGTHPTDLGFMRIAEALRPVLERALRS